MNISVVTAVYNCEKYLSFAIESVLNQTYTDFEYILLDDASTDGSKEIIDKYAKLDSRIKPVYLSQNMGRCIAFNKCIEEAKGDWIARLDADDEWLPEKLEKQILFLSRNPDVNISGTYSFYITKHGNMIGMNKEGPKSLQEFQQVVRGNKTFQITSSSLIVKKSLLMKIGGYREQFTQAEDIDLLLRLSENGGMACVLCEPLAKIRLHEDSISSKKYMEQRLMYKWARACMLSRHRGNKEPSLQEFIVLRNKRSIFAKINELRKDYGKFAYRTAGLKFWGKSYLHAFIFLLFAFCIHPEYALPRFFKQRIALYKNTFQR